MLVLAGTAVVGLIGYFVTWLVPRAIGVDRYAAFAVFWAAIFLVAAALSGVQQEITRATTCVETDEFARATRAMKFAIVAALVCGTVVAASSPLWSAAVFGPNGALVVPLALGCAAYVLLATIGGTLYGIAWWPGVFVMIVTEGVLRLVLVSLTLVFTSDVTWLAWAVVAPFPATAAVVYILGRTRIGRTVLDVGYRRLVLNVLRTVTAAASMGMLVSGFPLLLELTSHGVPTAQLGTVILTATLTRAPLIVVGMALQSYFVHLFRAHATSMWRILLLLLVGLLVLGGLLTVLAWWLGPTILHFLFPHDTMPQAWFIASLVATSCLVGGLCVAAPAVLARGAHTVFGVGWLVAAVGTVLGLLVPLPLDVRTIVALAIGPSAGLIVFLTYLVVSARSEKALS
ncbi:hypothetical protein GCM10027414_06640 [Humibacter ginsengiterrae]